MALIVVSAYLQSLLPLVEGRANKSSKGLHSRDPSVTIKVDSKPLMNYPSSGLTTYLPAIFNFCQVLEAIWLEGFLLVQCFWNSTLAHMLFVLFYILHTRPVWGAMFLFLDVCTPNPLFLRLCNSFHPTMCIFFSYSGTSYEVPPNSINLVAPKMRALCIA